MKVLWFVVTPPNAYKLVRKGGGWMASLEDIIKKKCPNIELGVAFEHVDKCFKAEADHVIYYPMNKKLSLLDKFKVKYDASRSWELLRPSCLKVIEDFKPDIIQVFGSEWPFGLLVNDTKIPIVVHMQGFVNIYTPSADMAKQTPIRFHNPIKIIKQKWNHYKSLSGMAQERDIMAANRYFMGRTEWDRNIVRYYSPNSKYFHCEEAIRTEIKECSTRWKFRESKKMQIVTISGASSLKGNEIILRTAKLLKEFNFDFEWRVAGYEKSFEYFEKKCGINHCDVNITTIGFVDAEDVAKELSEAQVYVHAAIIDNSPNSLCEAQLIGCPVVSTNVGGIPQLVENGVTGILYPYNEPHSLAFLLMNLHNNRERLEALSNVELEASHIRHDKDLLSKNIESIYTQIISKN